MQKHMYSKNYYKLRELIRTQTNLRSFSQMALRKMDIIISCTSVIKIPGVIISILCLVCKDPKV